jgi:hypothetical protein
MRRTVAHGDRSPAIPVPVLAPPRSYSAKWRFAEKPAPMSFLCVVYSSSIATSIGGT